MRRTGKPYGVGTLRRDAAATRSFADSFTDAGAARVAPPKSRRRYRVAIMVAMALFAWGLFIGAGSLILRALEAAGAR